MERSAPPVAPSLRERQREAVGQELRQAALELFADRGFSATSVDEIAARAGVSRSTFFRYFGSKEAVVVRDLDESTVLFLEHLRERPRGETRMEALEGALIDLTESMRTEERRGELLLVDRIVESDPDLASAQAARADRARAKVAQVLAARGDRAEPDLEDALAAAILGQITDHISASWRDSGDGRPARELIASHFESVRRLVSR